MPPDTNGNGDWKEWSQYVKIGIKDLKEQVGNLRERIRAVEITVTTIKVQMAFLGFLGGLAATAILNWLIRAGIF